MATQTENFNKADEDPFVSSNWTTWLTNRGKIVSNAWSANGSNSGIFWATGVTTFNNSHYSQGVVKASIADGVPGLLVRGTTGGNGYVLKVGATDLVIRSYASGTPTNLQTASSLTISAGDTIKFECNGTTLTGYQNGVQRIQITDSTYSSGQPGVHSIGVSGNDWDDWVGSDLTASFNTTGALVSGASVITGSSLRTVNPTGALVSGPSVIAGAAGRSVETVGTLNSQPSVLSGSVVFGALVTGTLVAGASVIAGVVGKARAVIGGLVSGPSVLSGALVGQPNEGQVVIYNVSSEAEPTSPFVRRVRIIATTDCHIKVNDPDNVQPATDEDMFLAAYKKERLAIRPGQIITVIQDSAPGRLYITENR